MSITDCWDVMPCSQVDGHQRLELTVSIFNVVEWAKNEISKRQVAHRACERYYLVLCIAMWSGRSIFPIFLWFFSFRSLKNSVSACKLTIYNLHPHTYTFLSVGLGLCMLASHLWSHISCPSLSRCPYNMCSHITLFIKPYSEIDFSLQKWYCLKLCWCWKGCSILSFVTEE
jgi:hypothetical protein